MGGFKKAIGSPLIKKSSLPPDVLKKDRSVSGLSFISKLVEHVVASQLNGHVTSNGLENVSQSAYKHGHLTKTALLSIKMKSILLVLDVKLLLLFSWTNQQHSTPLIIVLSLNCLSPWFGVGGVVLDWFKLYLCDSYQCIKIGSVLSDAKRLLYGVLQESVLGSIVFSLYTTPLRKVIQYHPGICFSFYTDDMQLCVHLTHKHATQAFDRLKNCLDDFKESGFLQTNSN